MTVLYVIIADIFVSQSFESFRYLNPVIVDILGSLILGLIDDRFVGMVNPRKITVSFFYLGLA